MEHRQTAITACRLAVTGARTSAVEPSPQETKQSESARSRSTPAFDRVRTRRRTGPNAAEAKHFKAIGGRIRLIGVEAGASARHRHSKTCGRRAAGTSLNVEDRQPRGRHFATQKLFPGSLKIRKPGGHPALLLSLALPCGELAASGSQRTAPLRRKRCQLPNLARRRQTSGTSCCRYRARADMRTAARHFRALRTGGANHQVRSATSWPSCPQRAGHPPATPASPAATLRRRVGD